MRVKSAFNDHGGGGDTKDKETHGDSVGGGGGGGGDHDDGGLVRLYPVMFSQGINEQQTFANAMGFSGFQEAINLAGVVGLRQYLERLSRYWEEEKGAEEGGAEGGAGVDVTRTQVLPQLPEQGKVEDTRKHLWEKLRALERRVEEARGSKAKHFEVLTESSMLARSMGGLRFTSCKSAKDRTGMSVTLEQARLLRTHYALSAETCAKATHLMRLHGTRLANAHKNIGRPTYAFNGLQLQMLPRAYRPPVVVAGKAAS